MTTIGHNNGPAMDAGVAWRTHCWTTARAALLPTLPIEVLRGRIRRARDLGLDYKTYASVRAATGHDVVAFLFSSNALRQRALSPALPAGRAATLAALSDVDLRGLATLPLTPAAMAAGAQDLLTAFPAPGWLAPFPVQRAAIRAALPCPSDRAVLIGDHALEAAWVTAGRLAGYVPADQFFSGS
jgi:hypothetical protein